MSCQFMFDFDLQITEVVIWKIGEGTNYVIFDLDEDASVWFTL